MLVLFVGVCLVAAVASGPAPVIPDEEVRIAFHVTVNEAQLPLLPRFLQRIYHADNLYLIDYAPPLSPRRHASKLYRHNVYHRQADPYTEHGVSEVINVLDGMSYFLDRERYLGSKHRTFEYFIHCSPEEYPTVNPTHMRRVLSFDHREYPPPNYFHFAHKSQWPLFDNEINRLYLDMALTFNRTLNLNKGLERTTLAHPDRRRRVLTLPRSDKHFVVNHEFVKLATDSMLSKRLLLTLGDTSHVYQHFFAALAHNTKDPVGRIIPVTSLRCVDSKALDVEAHQVLPNYKPMPPTIELLRNTGSPCLFTGPFDATHGTALFDKIDREFLIPPGTQGKPAGPGFHDRVLENLQSIHA